MSLMLPEAPRKKFILLSKFDKKNQKNIIKTSFFGLKLYKSNFIASLVSSNIQMLNPSQ